MTQATRKYIIDLPTIEDILQGAEQIEGTSAYRNMKVDLKIDPAKPTVYLILGPSGSGKDSILLPVTDTKGQLYCAAFIKTATNRKPRKNRGDGKPETDEYTWMSEDDDYPRDGEDENDFQKRVIEKYELIESSIHNGKVLYGLPLANLTSALQKAQEKALTPIIRTEIGGAESLMNMEEITNLANVVSIFILRDTEKVADVISQRENPEARMAKFHDEMHACQSIAHFFIVNEEGEEGLHTAQESLYHIIQQFMPEG